MILTYCRKLMDEIRGLYPFMHLTTTLPILFFLSIWMNVVKAQIQFEEGYFINNDGDKIECLIKNRGWRYNPTEFTCILSEDQEPIVRGMASVQEFGIYGKAKYERHEVEMDYSMDDLDKISRVPEPVFQKEILFLKQVIESEVDLFVYNGKAVTRYFIRSDNEVLPRQLVYKKYQLKEGQIRENNQYRRQLLQALDCEDIDRDFLHNIDYRKNDLTRAIRTYLSCKKSSYVDLEGKSDKGELKIKLRPGLKSIALGIDGNVAFPGGIEFERKISARFGVEVEYFLPFNRSKWSALIEPIYQYVSLSKSLLNQDVDLDYKSIELVLGARHYLFLNESNRIFLNVAYVIDIALDSKFDFGHRPDLGIRLGNNPAVGAGAYFLNKYSFELRYGLRRDLLNDLPAWTTNYRTISLILGINVF